MRAELLIGNTFGFALLPTAIGLRGLALTDPRSDDPGLESLGFMIFALFIVLRSVLWKVLSLKSWPCCASPGIEVIIVHGEKKGTHVFKCLVEFFSSLPGSSVAEQSILIAALARLESFSFQPMLDHLAFLRQSEY